MAKVAAYWITVNYRESYGMHASNGILFNHESRAPRRDVRDAQDHPRAGARSTLGLQDKLYLGNLDAKRDWGYAPDYTDAMWRMLQQDEPDDYVIATGEMHSVREFLDEAAARLGTGLGEARRDRPAYYRPAEVDALLRRCRPRRARSSAGSRRVTFKELVRIMVDADVKALEDRLAGRGVRVGDVSDPSPQFWEGKPVVVTGGAGLPRHARSCATSRRWAPTRRRALGRARPARSARRARGASTAPRSSSTSPPTSAASASTARNPAPLVYDNMMMTANMFERARAAGVDKLVQRVHGLRLPEVHAGAVLARTTSGTATRRSPTRPTGWPRR